MRQWTRVTGLGSENARYHLLRSGGRDLGNAPKQTFESYQAAAQAANSALTNADYESAEVSLRKAIRLGPQNPGVVYRLASVEARRGETARALALLERYAEMRIARDGDPDTDFGKLVSSAAYKRIKARMAENARATCPCDTVFTGDVQPFIAEGIARDPASGRMFIAGVHARKIVALAKGHIIDFQYGCRRTIHLSVSRSMSGADCYGRARPLSRRGPAQKSQQNPQ